ncbi:cell division protein FtsQ/DivIB [Flavobacterium sp. PLA-1-15]|uniref:cell division protein FtsQ/DivIB n=1 Tax=Flavobacterium sp. PLA-1-15 TaxID=3380533 RepID=UPI003B7CC0A6
MKKLNWRNIWTNVRLLLMLAVIAFLYSFTSKRNEDRKIKKPIVEFLDEGSLFLTHESVNKLLIEKNQEQQTIGKVNLDLNKLEKSINEHDMVEKSEVFVSIDGVLKAVVKQKTPIARVFENEGSFYIDSEGNRMPLSDINTARVPLVSGEINAVKEQDLYELLKLIHSDDFLKKNIIGVEVLHGGSLKMTNRNFNYVINFGKTKNVEKKFNNYKAFFQKAVQDSTISKYKEINLKFTQQVVCTK